MLNRLERTSPAPPRSLGAEHPANTQKEPQADAARISDQNEVTALPSPDGKQLVQYLLDSIRKSYPGVDVLVTTFKGQAQLRDFASTRANGITLVLSPEFLKKMEAGGEAFVEGSLFLDRVLAALTGYSDDTVGVGAYIGEEQAQFWMTEQAPNDNENPLSQGKTPAKSLFDWMKEVKDKAEEQEKKRIRVSGVTNNLMQTYSRLARASTVPAVKSVISGAQQSIYQLKLVASMGSTQQKDKARALLAQMDRAVVRARSKIRALGEEEDSMRRQRNAEKEQERQRAMQIAVERKKRQAARYARENAHLSEALTWSYQQAMRERQKLLYEEQQAQLSDMAAAPVSIPAAVIPAGGAAPAAPPVTVTVSEPVAVMI